MTQQQYLEEVARTLHSLPAQEREQELAEICAHLDATATAARLRGCTEQEAEAEAIRQFGAARQVGAGLQRAWWRTQIKGPRGLGKAVVLAVTLRYAVYGLLSPLTTAAGYAMSSVSHGHNNPSVTPFWTAGALLIMALPSLIVGMVLAHLAPRHAILRATLGSSICFLIGLLDFGASWTLHLSDPLQAILLIGTAALTTRHARKRGTTAC